MAIQPIDLSTIYSQMDKLGQLNASQMQASQEVSRQRLEKTAQDQTQKYQNVVETQKSAESAKVKTNVDEGGGAGETLMQQQGRKKALNDSDSEVESSSPLEIKDPKLGRHIDVTG